MKKMKFSESQIVNILKEAEAGVSLEELVRQQGCLLLPMESQVQWDLSQ